MSYELMKVRRVLFLIFPVVIFSACQSSRSIERKMLGMRSELFYELTTPAYLDANDTIYLKPIDYSAILPFTTVKKKGGLVIPLLIFNLVKAKYEVTLGEGSLEQPYYDFLMDALLAQCNRSSCFNLKVSKNDDLPDSALILEIKVNKNITTARMISYSGAFLNPLEENYVSGFSNWEINSPVSWLDISARLMQHGNCIWEKNYTDTQDLSRKRHGITEDMNAYKNCIDAMTENLSYATKGIVENISQNLHLIMLQKRTK